MPIVSKKPIIIVVYKFIAILWVKIHIADETTYRDHLKDSGLIRDLTKEWIPMRVFLMLPPNVPAK